MPGHSDESRGKVALVDAAEAGKAAGAVDEDLIPYAARVFENHQVFRQVEFRREIGDDIVGIAGDLLGPPWSTMAMTLP